MEFISGKIGSKIDIETKLRNSGEVIIATAYFKPRPSTMEALKKVGNLSLMYRNKDADYLITDPCKLMELTNNKGAEVRYVPDLHAKVYYGIRKKGSCFAFVGSANLTNDGLFSNHEAGILLDSKNPDDLDTIKKISVWLTELWDENIANKFDKAEHDRAVAVRARERARAKEVREIHPWKENSEKYGKDWENIHYYAIMPGKQKEGEDFHREFKEYKVVGIGYKDEPGKEGGKMVTKIKELCKGDLILVCRGYNTLYNHKVRIFAIARITDTKIRDFKHDRNMLNNINISDSRFKGWLKYWCNADVIEPHVEIALDSYDLREWLNKGSMEHAVQNLATPKNPGWVGFEKLAQELFDKYGLVIDI